MVYLDIFCSDTVFNLSVKVLTDIEIKVLEKSLDYHPIQNKINEPEWRKDFEKFCRRMKLKWHFRNDPIPYFKETPVFPSKSTLKPPKGHPYLEVLLSKWCIVFVSRSHVHIESTVFIKPCLNLCSFKWLKFDLRRFSSLRLLVWCIA